MSFTHYILIRCWLFSGGKEAKNRRKLHCRSYITDIKISCLPSKTGSDKTFRDCEKSFDIGPRLSSTIKYCHLILFQILPSLHIYCACLSKIANGRQGQFLTLFWFAMLININESFNSEILERCKISTTLISAWKPPFAMSSLPLQIKFFFVSLPKFI